MLVRRTNDPFFLYDMLDDLKALQPLEPEDLVDKDLNKRMFRHYLGIAFRACDLVLITTLYAPYRKNVEQWQSKALEHRSVDQEHPLFDVNNPRPDIHQTVYESWIETVNELKFHWA